MPEMGGEMGLGEREFREEIFALKETTRADN